MLQLITSSHSILHYIYSQNAIFFLPHFMAGVFAAALLECMHCAIWDFQRKRKIFREAREKSNKQDDMEYIQMGERIEKSALAYIMDVITFTETKPMLPW